MTCMTQALYPGWQHISRWRPHGPRGHVTPGLPVSTHPAVGRSETFFLSTGFNNVPLRCCPHLHKPCTLTKPKPFQRRCNRPQLHKKCSCPLYCQGLTGLPTASCPSPVQPACSCWSSCSCCCCSSQKAKASCKTSSLSPTTHEAAGGMTGSPACTDMLPVPQPATTHVTHTPGQYLCHYWSVSSTACSCLAHSQQQ